MSQRIEAQLDALPGRVYEALDELDDYPRWLGLVHAVEPAEPNAGEAGPAWFVTLRAKVGPFARAKRLRMVRTVAHAPQRLRFERAEIDDRTHAPWTLDVAIEGSGDGSHVDVELRYEGSLWTTPLEAILGSHVDAAVPRLQEFVSD